MDDDRNRDIFAVPVLDRWLIHAPRGPASALVNQAACDILGERGVNGAGPAADWADVFCRLPQPAPAPAEGPADPEFLGLIPTRACNMACRYCGFGAAGVHSRMDAKLAAECVDWFMEDRHARGRRTADIHFFGGEPFVAGELIDIVVHRARATGARLGVSPRFEAATNGFFDGDRRRFIASHFHTVVLSLDGPEEVHERHRPLHSGGGSFATVWENARALARSPAELIIRMCVTAETVGRMEAITRWVGEHIAPARLIYETLQATPESDAAGLAPPEPLRFAREWVAAARLARALGMEPLYAAAAIDQLRHSFCPVGRDSLIVAPDGAVVACYRPARDWEVRGMNLTLGRFARTTGMRLDAEAVDRVRALTRPRPECTACFARWYCAGGCHLNAADTPPAVRPDFCRQTRVIAAHRLLDTMGASDSAEALFSDEAALRALADFPDDRLAAREALAHA